MCARTCALESLVCLSFRSSMRFKNLLSVRKLVTGRHSLQFNSRNMTAKRTTNIMLRSVSGI